MGKWQRFALEIGLRCLIGLALFYTVRWIIRSHYPG